MSAPLAVAPILIVTTDPDLARIIQLALSELGLVAERFVSGRDAIRRALACRPAALILERDIPGEPAEALIEQLQAFESTRRLPTLILLDGGPADASFPMLRHGLDRPLRQPLSLAALRRALEGLGILGASCRSPV